MNDMFQVMGGVLILASVTAMALNAPEVAIILTVNGIVYMVMGCLPV